MANQEQIPLQQEQPFVAAKQVSFNLEDIILNTNNKVALLYPEHNNQDYFKCVFDFISKCYLRKPFTRSPDMYKECLWHLKLLNPLPLLRGFPKAQSLELNLDTRSNLLQNKFLCLAKRQQKVGPLRHPLVPKLAIPRKEKRVTSEARANPQLSSAGNDASAVSTAEADPGNSAPSDFVPQQQGINEGTKNTSYDHLFAGTDPHVLADQTKSVSKGLDTVLPQPLTGKGANSIARQVEEEEASNTIKLEDLAKLLSNVQPSFKDLDSPEDDHVIIIEESDKDKNDEIHATENVLILQSQKHKLGLEKNRAEAEAALLKTQPFFPNVEQLKELQVKSLKTELSNILSTYDFSSSLPTELKDIPSKLNELTGETVTSLTSPISELKSLQWELPHEFLSLPAQVATVQAKLKTLDALPGLLSHVTKALNKFAQVLVSSSSKDGEKSIPLAGQADTMLAEGEKNTNQATIS
ncbi:hypothetical protein Tco_1434281 [Tanacetum coccineum]